MKSRKGLLRTVLLAAIVFGASLAACSSDEIRLPRLAGNAVVLAFGDSLTYGTGAGAEESYPVILEKMIGLRVVNAGVPGEVTEEGLARLLMVLEREKPALVILCHGGNDLLRRLDQQQTVRNIQAMIRLSREKGAAVVLIAVPSMGLSLSPPPMYREIAKRLSVPLEGKALPAVLSDASLKSDPIHPNAAGYRRLAEAIAGLLKKSRAVD
ncbi:MAG: Esterase TesA precursor [Syntrophaceae bacterium PtaB.Bin095]|nr:MAG: Esterase TesA precursor [Syntrophaceae bacterium PtaB.Bin095]